MTFDNPPPADRSSQPAGATPSAGARSFWLDGAAVMATVFATDLLVQLVLKQAGVTATAGTWRGALVDAALLTALLALPLFAKSPLQ